MEGFVVLCKENKCVQLEFCTATYWAAYCLLKCLDRQNWRFCKHTKCRCVWSGSDPSPYEYCSGSWKPGMTTLSVRSAPVRGIRFQYIVRLNLRPCKCLPCKTKHPNAVIGAHYPICIKILSVLENTEQRPSCSFYAKKSKQLTWKEYAKGPSRCVLKTSCVRTRCWIFVSSFFSIIVSHKVTCQRFKLQETLWLYGLQCVCHSAGGAHIRQSCSICI